MVMRSKMVLDRVKSSLAVEQAIETHADEMAAALSTLLTPTLQPDEQLPDLAFAARLAKRNLAEKRLAMVAADEAHLAELSDDANPRLRRDEAAAALRGELAQIRLIAEGAYGPLVSANLFALEASVRDPRGLAVMTERVVARLNAPEFAAPGVRVRGVVVDPREWLAVIEPLLAELNAALAEVTREAREAESTLQAKNAAIADYDATFARTATLAESLFSQAGLAEIARKVRPSARRPGRTNEVPEEPPAGPPPVAAAPGASAGSASA
jgi:hypothetical protein